MASSVKRSRSGGSSASGRVDGSAVDLTGKFDWTIRDLTGLFDWADTEVMFTLWLASAARQKHWSLRRPMREGQLAWMAGRNV